MPTLVILFIIPIVLYFFYKIKMVRTKSAPATKRWINSKAHIALGCFIFFFGLNQIFLFYDSTITLIVSSIFILLGLANVILGYKQYRYFLPLAIDEAVHNKES